MGRVRVEWWYVGLISGLIVELLALISGLLLLLGWRSDPIVLTFGLSALIATNFVSPENTVVWNVLGYTWKCFRSLITKGPSKL